MIKFVYEMPNKPKVVYEMPKLPEFMMGNEITSSAFKKSVKQTKQDLATLVKQAGAERTVKVLMKVYPEWAFQAEPPQ